jgi:hypothetical protein
MALGTTASYMAAVGTLQAGIKYYWRVKSAYSTENVLSSIWSFTTTSTTLPTPFVTIVTPSNSPQTIRTPDNKVSVTIPGGVIDQAQKLTITPVTGGVGTAMNRLTNLGLFNISFEKTNTFQENITIEFSYDPSVIDTGFPNGGLFIAAYYDNNLKSWVTERSTVDTQRHKVVVQTDHLSNWGLWMAMKGYKAYYQKHFTIYYYPGDVLPAVFGTTVMSDFAFELGEACEEAFDSYDISGFQVPTYIVDVLLLDNKDSQFRHNTGVIDIGFANLKHPAMGYTACGHELFHSIQHASFSLNKASASGSHVWMLEGTPDYAAWAVAFSKRYGVENFMESGFAYDNFWKSPFADEQEHAYQLFYFWKYLDEQKGIKFTNAWTYLFFSSGLTSGSSRKALQDYIYQQTGITFSSLWSDFVNFTFFDTHSDLDWDQFYGVTSTRLHKPAVLSSTSTSANATFNLGVDHTADVWRVSLARTTPVSTLAQKVTVGSLSDLPSGTSLEIFILPGNRRNKSLPLGGATSKGFLIGSTKSATVDLNPTDGMYLVAKNTSSSAQSMTISVSVAAIAITDISPPSGTVGTAVTIKGNGFGVTNGTVTFNGIVAAVSSWSDQGFRTRLS